MITAGSTYLVKKRALVTVEIEVLATMGRRDAQEKKRESEGDLKNNRKGKLQLFIKKKESQLKNK